MRIFNAVKKNNSGLSIIEVMVAFGILVVAFVGLAQAFPFGLSVNKSAENATIASYFAQEKVEQLTSLGYDSVGVGILEPKQRLSSSPDDPFYLFQRETTVSYVDGNLNPVGSDLGLKKIIINMFFTDSISKKEKNYSITTLISKK